MAIKKSELYSSLWASCDELRGGMDASQYKDYVLVLLFVKYISDKFAGQPFAPIEIPKGATFQDMVALKGTKDIGDQINKKILAPIAEANELAQMPDFNDATKLGSGKEMVDRLTNLIAIFQKPELDFSKNRAEGDDILGDAYEYLMRHFATESGKSKGQFYTPAEVSRVMAKIIGVHRIEDAKQELLVYDPACGSGSLLLKVGSETKAKVTLYGQEKDAATSGLARMNMILHNNPTAVIVQGNTLSKPLFLEEGSQAMKTFDFVVANPPFSDKRWSNGLNLPEDGPNHRFEGFGIPPAKNGDYAFLLHIVRSLKRNGKGAVILPHGVLFRGNAEAEIRKNLIRKGYIKAIVGLPANLFYGTGIPACIILLDKENATARKGIFLVDAGQGFVKDGNKNRLREQDIYKIAEIVNGGIEVPGFSRMVTLKEIATNEYNLNIPRYIEKQEREEVQDIEAHLLGGIPDTDIEALSDYWAVFPNLKAHLFEPSGRTGYSRLRMEAADIKNAIFEHPEFVAYTKRMAQCFADWWQPTEQRLRALEKGFKPKALVQELAANLLQQYTGQPLLSKYDVYQHLMQYWNDTMQDDAYILSVDGWVAETYRIIEEDKAKKKKDKGWACDLLPKELVAQHYYQKELDTIEGYKADKESAASRCSELEEEHSGEGGQFEELDKINKAHISAALKATKAGLKDNPKDAELLEKQDVLQAYLDALAAQSKANKSIKSLEQTLDAALYNRYTLLDADTIKLLLVQHKWGQHLQAALQGEIDQISQRLAQHLQTLAARYAVALPELGAKVQRLEDKVKDHLSKMGYQWN